MGKDGEELEFKKEETPMGRTGVDRNTSGDTCVSFAAWPTSAAGSSISGFFLDKPGVTCDGGGGLLFKEVEAVFSRTGVDRNTSGELSGGSGIMGKNGEEQFKKAEAPCSRTGGSSVLVAAWPTSAAGSSITSGTTGGGAYFPDKPGFSCDGGGGSLFKEAKGPVSRTGVDRNTSGKLSGVSGFLGKDGVELEFKKEETPILRVGVDGIGKRSRRRGRKQERQHGAVALASASSYRAAPAGQPEEDTTSVPEGDLCGSCRREALLRRRADVCALQMECDELAVMAAGGCPVKHLKSHQLRLGQQLRVLDVLLAGLEAESCFRCGLCLDAAFA